jgi:hypothetical protein
MSRPGKVTAADLLNKYVSEHATDVVKALNDIGLWHVSPCTDAGFKHALGDYKRATHFVRFFSELLDASSDPSCRMLSGGKILAGRKVRSLEKIPESIEYKGDPLKGRKSKSEKAKKSGLPKHPEIDSGFIARLYDGEAYRMGIEMQVIDEGNMLARGVDYGSRIFRYEGEDGGERSVHKVFEFLLSRWGIESAPNKLISFSGKEGAECDKDVGGELVNSVCLCCISIFLGKSIDIMNVILEYLQYQYPEGSNGINDADKRIIRDSIKTRMEQEREVLSKQIVAFIHQTEDVYNITYDGLDDLSRRFVDRLGFFKYGHLMSEEDINGLGDEDLKRDYQCIKIKEENVMENIGQISAIWGELNPYNDTTNAILELEAKVQRKDEEIARLKKQLAQAQPKAASSKRLAERRARRAQESSSEKSDSNSETSQ